MRARPLSFLQHFKQTKTIILRDIFSPRETKKCPREGTIVPSLGHYNALRRHFFQVLRWNFIYLLDVFFRTRNSIFNLTHLYIYELAYSKGFRPSHFTFQLPSCGKPGLGWMLPSHPAHIIATAINRPPLPGK